MKSGLLRSRQLELYIKCMSTYIIIFFIVLALVAGMYIHMESTIQDMLSEAYQHRLDMMAKNMESAIARASTSATLYADNNAVVDLSKATNQSLQSNIITMRSAKDSLDKVYVQLNDDFVSIFLVYPHNDYIITNNFITNNFHNEYGTRFSFNDLSADEWKNEVLKNVKLQPTLLSAMRYRSIDLYMNECNVISLVVPLSKIQYRGQTAAMVFLLNIDHLRKNLQPENGVLFSVADTTGTILAGDLKMHETSNSLVFASSSSSAPLFTLSLSVPHHLIDQKMSVVAQYIKIYIIFAMTGILILSAFFAFRHFYNLRKLVDVSSSVPSRRHASLYSYALDVVKSLSEMRDTLVQKLTLTESTYANNLLINVCKRGIASSEDFSVCEQLLSSYLSDYCITVVKTSDEHSVSIAYVEAESKFLEFTKAMAIRSDPTVNIYIVRIDRELTQQRLCDVATNCFGEYGHIGISRKLSDVHLLHEGYQQAYSLAGLCTDKRKCLLYDKTQTENSKICLDIASLLKLQDYIYATNIEKVEKFFCELEENSKGLIGTDLFHIFFVIRQMLLRVSNDIPGAPADATPMNFTYDESAHDLFERLRLKALSIIEQTRNHKSDKSDKITNTILSMIESDFDNPNISADYLADKLMISSKYVYQKVKERTGKPLGDIIEEHRLNYATELLISTDKKNEEIAYLCGYSTLNTFYRVFRKHYSLSPGEWRKRSLHIKSIEQESREKV